jgi:hypothetical protein
MPGIDPRGEPVARPTHLGIALLVVMVASWFATGFDDVVFLSGWVVWAAVGLVVAARELDF